MKKIYLLGISALMAVTSVAQTAKKKMSFNNADEKVPAHKTYNFKNKGVVKTVNARLLPTPNQTMAVWSDDFSTPANWVSNDNTATSQAWSIGTTGPASSSAFIINSTSGGNFALFDSDAAGQTAVNNCDLTLVTPINLTGHPNVVLSFEQDYIHYADVTSVYVSGDNGTTWTQFVVNGSYATNQQSANPETVSIDISSVAGNMSQVLVRFNYQGAWDYWWEVDDVSISDMPAYDMSVIDGFLWSTNNQSACFLTQDTLLVVAKNTGINAITVGTPGDSMTVSINGTPMTLVPITLNTALTPVTTINSGDTVVLLWPMPIDLSTAGMTYNIDANISYAGSGDVTAMNDTMATISIINVATTPLTSANYTNGFETDYDLAGVHFLGLGGQATGISQTTFHSGAQAIFMTITGGSVPDSTYGTLVALQCTDVVANETYRITYWRRTSGTATSFNGSSAAFVGTDPNDSTTFTMISSAWSANTNNQWKQDSADYTPSASGTVYFGLGGQGYTTAAQSINCRFDDVNIFKVPSVGIKENAVAEAVAVFPNPSNGTFTVKAIEAGSVEVYSVLGENVYTAKVAKGNNTVDLSTVAAGTYVVKVKGVNQTITKRIVINK